MSRLIQGWGINDIYEPSSSPFYRRWTSMINRSSGSTTKNRNTSAYDGCKVCEDWRLLSNFKRWMQRKDWEGNHLDKDILGNGNKIYSPATCCFVPPEVNWFLVTPSKTTNIYPSGVRRKDFKTVTSYVASVNVGGKVVSLGYFRSILAAYEAWIRAKRSIAIELAKEIKDEDIARVFLSYVNSERFYRERSNGYA